MGLSLLPLGSVLCTRSSAVERYLPKILVEGSTPSGCAGHTWGRTPLLANQMVSARILVSVCDRVWQVSGWLKSARCPSTPSLVEPEPGLRSLVREFDSLRGYQTSAHGLCVLPPKQNYRVRLPAGVHGKCCKERYARTPARRRDNLWIS